MEFLRDLKITGTFALPRAVYAMADDGLIFSFLAKINKFTKVWAFQQIRLTTTSFRSPWMQSSYLQSWTPLWCCSSTWTRWSSFCRSARSQRTQSSPRLWSSCDISLHRSRATIPTNWKWMMVGQLQKKLSKFCFSGGSLRNWVPFRSFWDNQPAGRSICVGLFFLIIGYFWLAFTFRLGQFEHF